MTTDDAEFTEEEASFDLLNTDLIRYVQNANVSRGGFMRADGGIHDAVFLKVFLSRTPHAVQEADEEVILALTLECAQEMSEVMQYLTGDDDDDDGETG